MVLKSPYYGYALLFFWRYLEECACSSFPYSMRQIKTLSVWICGWLWMVFSNREISVAGKLGGQDSFESIDSFESCDRLTQSWSSQSSFNSLQRVPSYDSFDSEDYPAALHGLKPKGTFKDYVRERSDLSKDKPVIPAAALAGYTGQHYPGFICSCNKPKWVRIQINTRQKASALRHSTSSTVIHKTSNSNVTEVSTFILFKKMMSMVQWYYVAW